jgi:hypothetical protein
MAQNQSIQLKIKSSVFDRHRELTIDKSYIEFDNNDLSDAPPTRFNKEDIKAFRYGVKWIQGYQFIIGRIYCIDIRNNNDRVIKLRLKSLYGIRKKILTDKYAQIVHALYDHFFDDLTRQYLTKFDNNVEFELGGLLFNQEGISFGANSDTIPWTNIGTASYKTYYTIYPKSHPNKYKAFEYLHHWNAGIVYSVSRQILKHKGLFTG